MDTCYRFKSSILDKALGVENTFLTSAPQATMTAAYNSVCQLGLQTVQCLGDIMVNILSFTSDLSLTFLMLMRSTERLSPGIPPGSGSGPQEHV